MCGRARNELEETKQNHYATLGRQGCESRPVSPSLIDIEWSLFYDITRSLKRRWEEFRAGNLETLSSGHWRPPTATPSIQQIKYRKQYREVDFIGLIGSLRARCAQIKHERLHGALKGSIIDVWNVFQQHRPVGHDNKHFIKTNNAHRLTISSSKFSGLETSM